MAEELIPKACLRQLKKHEAELDEIWPGWRKQERFDSTPKNLKARIKWLLKRRILLLQGKNVEVLIVWKKGKTPDQDRPFAHPVLDLPFPARGKGKHEPPKPDLVPIPIESIDVVKPSIPMLAMKHKLPVEKVEALLASKPKGVSDNDWLAKAKAKEGGNEA